MIIYKYLIDHQSDNDAVSVSDSNDDSGLDVKSVNNVQTPLSLPSESKSELFKVIILNYF